MSDVSLFVEYAKEFANTPASKLLLKYSKAIKAQQRLQFGEFTALCSTLMLQKNTPVIEKCKEKLMAAPLNKWQQIIEEVGSSIHLTTKNSVQEAIDEFIEAYGPIEKAFAKDLFLPSSLLELVSRDIKCKPHPKQLGLAHYCVGSFRKVQR